jgi:hypothetical protein
MRIPLRAARGMSAGVPTVPGFGAAPELVAAIAVPASGNVSP